MKHCAVFAGRRWLLWVGLVGLPGAVWGQAPLGGRQYPLTHRFAYEAVVLVAGVSQADLVLRARAWAQRAARAGQVPVLATGPGTEVVRTTAARPFACDWGGKALLCELRYTATISVRAGRYKYELKDFVLVEPGAGRYPASAIPAESYYNGSFHPYNAIASRFQVTMRACFTGTVNEELARLQEGMRNPVRTARSQ